MLKYFRITVLLALIGWMILIFCLSAETAEVSSKTSGGIVSFIVKILIPSFDTMSAVKQDEILHCFQFVIRKTAHFTIFAILGALSYLNIATYKNILLKFRVAIASLFCLVYAISDELHQLGVDGRSGEIRDVLIDFCGALLGIFILNFVVRKFFKKYT